MKLIAPILSASSALLLLLLGADDVTADETQGLRGSNPLLAEQRELQLPYPIDTSTTFHIKGTVYKKDEWWREKDLLPGAEVTCFNALRKEEVCRVTTEQSTESKGSFDCKFKSSVLGQYYCKVTKGLSFEACHGDHPSKPEFLIKVGTNVEGIQFRYLSDDGGVPKLADDERDSTEKWYWDDKRLVNGKTGRALAVPKCENGARVILADAVDDEPKQQWKLTMDDRLQSKACPKLYLHKGGSKHVLDKLLIRNDSYNTDFRQNWLPTCDYGEMERTSYTSKTFFLNPTGGHKTFNLKDASKSNYNDVKLDGDIILYSVTGSDSYSSYYTTRGECTPPTKHPVWFHSSCLYHDRCYGCSESDKNEKICEKKKKQCNADFLDLLMNQCREFLIEGNTPRTKNCFAEVKEMAYWVGGL